MSTYVFFNDILRKEKSLSFLLYNKNRFYSAKIPYIYILIYSINNQKLAR